MESQVLVFYSKRQEVRRLVVRLLAHRNMTQVHTDPAVSPGKTDVQLTFDRRPELLSNTKELKVMRPLVCERCVCVELVIYILHFGRLSLHWHTKWVISKNGKRESMFSTISCPPHLVVVCAIPTSAQYLP